MTPPTTPAPALPTPSLPTPVAATPADTHGKALAINLDTSKYGTFAEIGAGQEVARWFLRVGAAAGTVAQTISAYDKTFSDDTYGAGTRYVSRERLLAMLDHEYRLLRDRLDDARGGQTKFFVFADTVAARNFRGDNEQHGWLGIRFQSEPRGAPADVLLHVNLMDPTAQRQQEALGVLGVNLVYAAFHQRSSPEAFLAGLFDHLSRARLEIDVIELSGPAFDGEDGRRWCLAALMREMCHAIVLDAAGTVVEPSALLRKRPLIIERGQFSRTEAYQSAMLRSAERQLKEEGIALAREPVPVLETTARHATARVGTDGVGAARETGAAGAAGEAPTRLADLIEHAGRANALGPVIVSDFPQTFRLVEYLRRYTAEPIRLVVGVAGMVQLMHKSYYDELPGSLLEGLGKLLATNVKIYVYPMPAEALRQAFATSPHLADWSPASGLVSIDDIHPPPPFSHLFDYLRESGWVMPIAPA